MPVQQTSRAAYDELQPTLPVRQARVLTALRRYRDRVGEWPTAYELFEAMRADGTAKDINDVRPRLTELKEKARVENPTIKRHCRMTRKRAFTWSPVQPTRLF